jgi:site-specific DNA-cytosine methylase
MLRVIREVQPSWVVGENVLGLVNWSGGLVFHEVQVDLETAGYEVFPFVLPACGVGAPHRRDRVWFVAHRKNIRCGDSKETGREREEHIAHNRQRVQSSFDKFSEGRTTSDTNGNGFNQCNGQHEINTSKGGQYAFGNANKGNVDGDVADTISIRRRQNERMRNGESNVNNKISSPRTWQNFPTVSPLRMRNDGVSNKLLRFVVNQFYDTNSYTSEKNRIKNLQEVWGIIQQEEIWEQIRGLYSLESKDILFQTMQLYSARGSEQRVLSPYSEKFCEPILQHLRKHKEFRCSPQGQELGKQRANQFGNSLSFLPHEVALAARRFETAVAKFEAWHRNESIKAAGNAIVPQVAFQIFKSIEESIGK